MITSRLITQPLGDTALPASNSRGALWAILRIRLVLTGSLHSAASAAICLISSGTQNFPVSQRHRGCFDFNSSFNQPSASRAWMLHGLRRSAHLSQRATLLASLRRADGRKSRSSLMSSMIEEADAKRRCVAASSAIVLPSRVGNQREGRQVWSERDSSGRGQPSRRSQ